MIYCYKESKRPCDDACAAYCSNPRHDTNCLELASQIEISERMKGIQLSNDLNTLYNKILAQTMTSLRGTLKSVLK